MENKIPFKLVLTILSLTFTNMIFSQKVDLDHKLLWRISSPTLAQDSYVFGTMHIKDKRVFNFTDSLYLKIEECQHFALEVHPDTLSKTLIVDPLNATFDAALEEMMYDDDLEEFKDELEEDTGIDFSNVSRDNLDLIPILFKKLFKKEKDKNTILDAHLYHIARVLGKNIVGLESIQDHKRALRSISKEELPDLPKLISKSKQYDKILSDLIDLYSSGDVELLHKKGGYQYDSIMSYRNHTMVNSAIPYIEDGGIFMAVGAAHIAGEEGIVQLLQDKGYKVEPVVAQFSKKVLKAELADKEIEWVTDSYLAEGFSVSTPDHAYNYQPESTSGLMTIRSYPDLGRGCLFFYSATPLFADGYSLSDVEEELRTNLRKSNQRLLSKNIKYGKYLGYPSLTVKYNTYGQEVLFKYVLRGNYLYLQGVTPLAGGKPDKKVTKDFFESLKFIEFSKNDTNAYTDLVGAYTVKTGLLPQKFSQVDGSGGYNSTTESINFIDQASKLIHMVLYTYNEAGYVFDNVSAVTDDYELNFSTPGDGDSIIYSRDNKKWGGTEILIEFDDNTFLRGTMFVRGNRAYQVLHAGAISEENFQKCREFEEGFQLLDYQQFDQIKLETDNFSSQFPQKPIIDTLLDSYEIHSFATKATTYSSLDLNSSLNYVVSEYNLSPYSTFESVDSTFKHLKDLYDEGRIISQSEIEIRNGLPSFSFQTRGDNSQLDHNYLFYLGDDVLYELSLVQDSSAINDRAKEQFLSSFKPNQSYNNSLLIRDSAVVKDLILKDIFSTDTLKMIAASELISEFNITKQESQSILTRYNELSPKWLPESYQSSMIKFLCKKNPNNLASTLKQIYSTTTSDQIQIDILSSLTENDSESNLLLVKELLKIDIPESEYSWKISSIFHPFYVEPNSITPLIPEIFSFTKRDSVTLTNLYVKLLEDGAITIQELDPLYDIFKGKSQQLFSLLQDLDEEETYSYWSEKSELSTLASIFSFAKPDSTSLRIFEYFEADSSYYHKLDGITFLLRQGIDVDGSNLYDASRSYTSIQRMYELEREFDKIDILPDSMMTLEKFVITSALAYPEEEEYLENATAYIIEEIVEDNKLHYFIKCDYHYDDDDEIYELLLYAVVDAQGEEFKIPTDDEIYTDYYYVNETDLETAKEDLRNFYKQ